MNLEYGLLPSSSLSLTHEQLIPEVENALNAFSYDSRNPPDFRGLFAFLVADFDDCEDLDVLRVLVDMLSNIAGYKLGIYVADLFPRATPIILKLLASHSVAHMKSAVDFFRKVARVVGPRLVLQAFVAPNVHIVTVQRGLAIIAHQAISDNPNFPWKKSDFGDWVSPLSTVVSVGPRLISVIKEKVPNLDCDDGNTVKRPPSVPVKFNLASLPTISNPANKKPPIPPPHSARPKVPHRILPRRATEPQSVIFQLTSRQQQVRDFVDQPFSSDEKVSEITQQMLHGISNNDWEERSAAYNVARRIIRYSSQILDSDDIHSIITAVLDDVSSPRAALALSSIGALSEAFNKKPADMELELGRVFPVLLKQHQKTAQFFENALTECFDTVINAVPAKRFMSILLQNSETRSTKVQSALSKYCKNCLIKCQAQNEKLFGKNTSEVGTLVKLINKLLAGAAAETRDAARDAAHTLSQIYGDSFMEIVQRNLESRDASQFIRSI